MKSSTLFRILKMTVLCGYNFFRFMRSSGLTGGKGLVILSSHEGVDYGRRETN